MNCDDADILIHALLDGELDAGNARGVEAHIACCPKCAALIESYSEMQQKIVPDEFRFQAPAALRRRIEATLAVAPPRTDRRVMLKGFALGSALSAIAATGLVLMVLPIEENQHILSDLTSAHLRSLQAEHLTDVVSTDQHTVKPWFNGRLDVAPPVIDLAGKGFTLIGGRLDYLDGHAIGAIVYRRRQHVINLFVAQAIVEASTTASLSVVQGFNIWRWSDHGLNYWAVSDLNRSELSEFGAAIETALKG